MSLFPERFVSPAVESYTKGTIIYYLWLRLATPLQLTRTCSNSTRPVLLNTEIKRHRQSCLYAYCKIRRVTHLMMSYTCHPQLLSIAAISNKPRDINTCKWYICVNIKRYQRLCMCQFSCHIMKITEVFSRQQQIVWHNLLYLYWRSCMRTTLTEWELLTLSANACQQKYIKKYLRRL